MTFYSWGHSECGFGGEGVGSRFCLMIMVSRIAGEFA